LHELAQPTLKSIEPIYWASGGDEGPNYCLEHAKKKVDELKAAHPGNEEDYSVGGGYGTSEDTCAACETCGKLLEYSLTRHGVVSELDNFESVSLSYVKLKQYSGTAYELGELLNSGEYYLGSIEHPDISRGLKRLIRRLEGIHARALAH
jgi:hypothetical protein